MGRGQEIMGREWRGTERMAERLKLPKDMVFGAAIVTMIGRNELYVENFRSIAAYSDCCLCLQTKLGRLRIQGRNIRIDYYNSEEIKVIGRIECVQFE